jgi:hypothetical protein
VKEPQAGATALLVGYHKLPDLRSVNKKDSKVCQHFYTLSNTSSWETKKGKSVAPSRQFPYNLWAQRLLTDLHAVTLMGIHHPEVITHYRLLLIRQH